MGWLNRTVATVWNVGHQLGGIGGGSNRRAVVDLDALLAKYFGYESKSGAKVTVETALGVTTVLACTRALAEGVSQIPFKLMIEDDNEVKTVAKTHPAHRVVSRRPNSWMTSFGLRETLMYHAVLTGNGVAYKNMVRGQLRELIPIMPSDCRIRRQKDYSLRYEVLDQKGEKFLELGQSEIFHLVGPTWNNYSGLDILRLTREAVGLALAAEENHSRLHQNGSQVGGQLTTDKPSNPDQVERLRTLWASRHVGLSNAYKTAVLDNGWKWQPIGMSGVDAEHIKTREHQVQEICRALGVFPMIIGFADKTATFASAEAFFTAHVMLSLGPWVQRWQDTANTQLLTEQEGDQGYYFKLFTAGLMRGDARARSEFYKSGILTGWMTRNEARGLEDMNKIDGLDDPLVPLNMGVAGEEAPDPNLPADQRPASSAWPNVPIAPLSAVRQMGHNGGPPLDDDTRAAVQAYLPTLEAAGNPRRLARAKALLARSDPKNVGRVLSGTNERRIRDAGDLIGQADSKLVEVLSELDDKEEAE